MLLQSKQQNETISENIFKREKEQDNFQSQNNCQNIKNFGETNQNFAKYKNEI